MPSLCFGYTKRKWPESYGKIYGVLLFKKSSDVTFKVFITFYIPVDGIENPVATHHLQDTHILKIYTISKMGSLLEKQKL